jgi:TonB-linked SusC/RagA family outer membrane protein
MCSRQALFGLLAQFILANSLLALDSEAQKAKDLHQVYITVTVEGISLPQFFELIEEQSDFLFNYNKFDVEPGFGVSGNYSGESLYNILLDVSRQAKVQFKQVNENITVVPISKEGGGAPIEINLQGRTVTGSVKSGEDDSGLPGVNVVLQGSSIGTITDIEGNFSLEVLGDGAVLVFSSVGFTKKEVAVGNQSVFDITLTPDITALDEIVVVGYGTSSKRALTGSVEKVDIKELNNNTATNIAAGLQGRVSGVQVLQNNGAPGSGAQIRVRGVSSISLGSDPLIVVDGIPAAGLGFNEINPNDIESIEVLKDAAAASIYGSRAANGVIMVTTKKGKAGKSVFNIDYQHGINTPTNELEIANNQEWLGIMDRAYNNQIPGRGPFPILEWDGFDRELAEQTNTDWMDLVSQDAYYNQIGFSTSGGSDKTTFYISSQYRDEFGINPGNRFQRVNARISLDHRATEWLKVGTNITGNYRFRNNPYTNYSNYYTNLLPMYPINSPEREGRYFFDRNINGDQGINPLYRRDETWGDNQEMKLVANIYGELTLLKGLTLRTDWSVAYTGSRNRNYESREFRRRGDGIDPTQEGAISIFRSQRYFWNSNNYLTYERNFGDHFISAMAGYTMESSDADGNGITEEGFPSDDFTLTNANTEVVLTRVSSSINQYRFQSYIGRLKYGFKDRYFAEINFRRDGSSRFGPNNRWGNFGGGAVSWLLSEEEFMSTLSWVDNLKLRASYGSVGNASFGNNYPYLSTLVNWGNYGGQAGFFFRNIGNLDIGWEEQFQTNVGLDFALFDGVVSGSFDYFEKNPRNLIVDYRVGNYHGYFSTGITVNLGNMENKGFDFSLTTRNIRKGNFTWITDFNISRARPVVTKMSETQSWLESGTSIAVEGQPLGAFYMPIWGGVDPETGHELILGVDQTKAENRNATQNDLSGQIFDATAMDNGRYNAQRAIITDKTPYPDFYGGLNNTLTYKNFDLSFLFSYQFGNYIYSDAVKSLMTPGDGKNLSPDLLEGWSPENPTNTPLIFGSPNNGRNSTRFLYDGSFVRLRNMQIGYNLPQDMMQSIGIRSMRVYLVGQNLLTFTNYPGQDPEFFNGDLGEREANISPGVDGLGYPQMRTFMVGVNLGL